MADLYTTDVVVDMVRRTIADTAQPYLISDEQIAWALDAAQRRFAEVSLCLRSYGRWNIDVVAGTHTYTRDPRLMQVVEGYLTTARQVVRPMTMGEFGINGWQRDYGLQPLSLDATGTPQYLLTDQATGSFRLAPTPIANDTLVLSTIDYPEPLRDVDSALSIPDRYRPYLVDGVVAQLYRIQDAELYDKQAAETWEMSWRDKMASARNDIERDVRGPGIVRPARYGVW